MESNDTFLRLLNAFKSGDASAKDTLVQSNLGLVGAVVARFSVAHEEREDLFQVGCIGLLKALDKFDPDRGFRFSTYAFHTVLGEIRRHLRDSGPLRVSRTLKERAARLRSIQAELAQSLGREPTLQELVDASDYDHAEIVMAFEASSAPISLHEPAYEGGDDSVVLGDRISAPERDEAERLSLLSAIVSLPSLEQQVIRLRYKEELTQAQAALRLGISQSQVSRLERTAIVRMRGLLE